MVLLTAKQVQVVLNDGNVGGAPVVCFKLIGLYPFMAGVFKQMNAATDKSASIRYKLDGFIRVSISSRLQSEIGLDAYTKLFTDFPYQALLLSFSWLQFASRKLP